MTGNAEKPAAVQTVRVGLPVNATADDVFAYAFRADVIEHWLGATAKLTPEVGSKARLRRVETSESSHWVDGIVVAAGALIDGRQLGLRIEIRDEHDAPTGGFVEIRILPTKHYRSTIKIKHSGLSDEVAAKRALKIWQTALNKLGRLLAVASSKRRSTRQAIVVVHGVGEQRPGQTLRNFVEGVFPESRGDIRYMKPDYVSELFEMRRATVAGKGNERPTTDIYEMYWAHLIRDTSIGQVYGWVLKLMFSRGDKIPSTLKGHIWFMRIIGVVALAAAGWFSIDQSSSTTIWGSAVAAVGALAILPSVLWFVWKVFRKHFVLGYAGDAARYLEPKPDNIEKRQKIREAGVKLLDDLHDKGEYDRIVVYGHSLGSVIAYDILSHLWIKRSRKHGNKEEMRSSALMAVENLLNPRETRDETPSSEVIQQRQNAAWKEYRDNGFEWLISDFVTAGSPLAHARWLLNLDKKTQFDDLVEERSMPTCPPQTEDARSPRPGVRRKAFTFTHAYGSEAFHGRKRSVQVPHHAALYALTRWSNLYFPFSGISKGDPIAGPLQQTFGTWIKDIELEHPGAGFLGFTHTLYSQDCGNGSHVERLREALALPYGDGLDDPILEAPETQT